MEIKWTPDMAVGIGEIDEQHRDFIAALSGFTKALSVEKKRDAAAKEAFDFLCGYAEKHFTAEEMYMTAFSYPGGKDHKAIHDKFRGEITALREGYEAEGGAEHAARLTEVFYGWLVNHIKTVDTKLGEFLKGRLK
ncbi:MAG TPA: bacteriohemerythrin [bacterium]|nr:bacteriohemerythrin [bacterium]